MVEPFYIFLHQNDPFPLGVDYDLYIINPSGVQVVNASSTSRYNPYELVEFNTSGTSGNYTFKVCRASKRNPNNRFDMGIAVMQK